ncbi:hypothetical protein AYI68_g1349 [Smittium mucronatum]|uniref:Uncharacterized protein n=1 Tax=Smittium mucronatum TaxID=133383 RepID=A0A1R0H5X8_9FUNG|nr:hypothetical protein AYI68_g1349 [Smittium mucronatum]
MSQHSQIPASNLPSVSRWTKHTLTPEIRALNAFKSLENFKYIQSYYDRDGNNSIFVIVSLTDGQEKTLNLVEAQSALKSEQEASKRRIWSGRIQTRLNGIVKPLEELTPRELSIVKMTASEYRSFYAKNSSEPNLELGKDEC